MLHQNKDRVAYKLHGLFVCVQKSQKKRRQNKSPVLNRTLVLFDSLLESGAR